MFVHVIVFFIVTYDVCLKWEFPRSCLRRSVYCVHALSILTEFWRFSSERRCCICNKNLRGNVAAYKWKVHIVIPSQNHFRNFHIRHPKPKGLHKPISSNELSVVTSLWKRLFPNANKDIYSTSVRHGHLIQSQKKNNSNKTQWVSQ